ncbi:MAG: hypothetical protein ACP5RH_14935 [Leptodesmis sp.]
MRISKHDRLTPPAIAPLQQTNALWRKFAYQSALTLHPSPKWVAGL